MTDDPTTREQSTSTQLQTFLPAEPVRWGWPDVFIGLAAFFGTLVFGVLAIVVLQLDARNGDVADLFGLASALFTYGALIAVLVVASRKRGLGSLAADFGLRFQPVDLAIGLGIGLLAKVLSVAITLVVVSLTNHVPEQGNFVLSTSTLFVVLNGVLVASIVGPIVEELYFRGLLLRAAGNRVMRRGGDRARATAVAIAVSSIGFALLHLYQAMDLTLLLILGGSTLALGLLNSWVSIKTGRLGAAIVAHMLFNGSTVWLSLVAS